MAKPRDVVVRFLADTRDFLRGTDNVEGAYRDMARGADRVADQGEDSARRIARAYDKAGDDVRRDAKKTQTTTAQAYGDAGKEAGAEFAQNVGESVSSGDIGGLLSGTVGGLVGTFGAGGPIGLALAGLATVGIGVFSSLGKAAEEAAARAQTVFDELKSGASREARFESVLEQRFGSTVEGLKQVQKWSDVSGVSVEAISAALTDGGPAARTLATHFEDIARNAYETDGALDNSTGSLINGQRALEQRADDMERAATAAVTERNALSVSEGILRRSASYYAVRGSAYAPGGSVYNSQVPRYTGGKRGP